MGVKSTAGAERGKDYPQAEMEGPINQMTGKTVIITGANRGIGKATTAELARRGAAIIMACRNLEQAEEVRDNISRETGNNAIRVLHLDLASLDSARQFTDKVSGSLGKDGHLDVLINNAGTFNMKRIETTDGFEMTMATNYFGHFLITNRLLPNLHKAPRARIVNVASDAHLQGKIDLNDIHLKKRYLSFKAYATSRLATLLFTKELAKRLNGTRVTVNSCHPGHVATNMWKIWPNRRVLQWVVNRVAGKFLMSPEEGAWTSVYLATSDEVSKATGEYYFKDMQKKPSPLCLDENLAEALWKLSEQLTGIS